MVIDLPRMRAERGNNMARLPQGVRRRKDGTLEKRITINGKRYSLYAGTSKEIIEKEQELREQIRSGQYQKNNNITLNDYVTKWIQERQLGTKGNSLRVYNSIYKNHIAPQIGRCKVKDIELRQIKEIQTETSKTQSITTCNYILTVIKIILNDAVKDEIIINNPANNVKPLKDIKAPKKASETYHRALTEQEQQLFMQALKGNYYYEFFALALCSGMRFGELCALKWGDIDQDNNVIHVTETQTFTIENKATKGSPKTTPSRA